MAEKDMTKKLLVLLVVLVALSLVVDLLSLNVLYGINKEADLSGELATYNAYYDKPVPDPYCVADCEACKNACADDQCRRDCAGGGRREKSCEKYCT